jgi:NAD(P)-dependent dehydrogenase (short-subunit alcohol dehydrogenase family)
MRKIFLTGASAGIGLATAQALIRIGCEVWGTSRDLERLPRDLAGFHPVMLDLNDEASLPAGFAAALAAAGGRFDVIINNAGGGWFGPGAEIPSDDLKAQFQLLALSPIRLMQLALPSLRLQPGGTIVNVTSLAARLPLPFGAPYSAAKAALSVYTAALQMEETAPPRAGRYRVRFVDFQPGDINTGFNRAMSYWPGLQVEDDPTAKAVRRSLHASDASMAGAPPPDLVAQRICGLVQGAGGPLITCGNVWQGVGGSLAYRFLPRRLLLWTIRKNCGL